MRIKEAAEQSGLTEKAIRLYEEKGLITPTITEKSGRKFRDYDEATVALLKTIGGLRRSFFSLEQIAAMQQSPERIPEVFSQYRAELKEQYDRLGMLIGKADEILAQLPAEGEQIITPAVLRNVDTLSEAMTAVTPVVVSEEIPVSAPPKGRREHAEVHFRRWDEEISTDEREIVYQRYLEYYSRWEKRYAAELAVGTVFDWVGRYKKVVVSLLAVCLLGLLVYHTGIYTDYDKTFDGYMLVYDYFNQTDDVYDKPLWTEPVTIRLKGRIRHYLFQSDLFEGQILS
ncbi:MAG: MerR family transcriptional regulator, partial [Clostridia bacterium]|nr:MerR family transcriptional regulator [Clostridia bacterium]